MIDQFSSNHFHAVAFVKVCITVLSTDKDVLYIDKTCPMGIDGYGINPIPKNQRNLK
jgi:hypothetical protein